MSTEEVARESLAPYEPTRDWTRREATHVLWRLQFGATAAQIDRAVELGLAATLDRFLERQPETTEFDDAEKLLRRTALDTGNISDLKAWWLYRMLNSANPLVEKMTLLWHNHFATSYAKVQSVPFMADQNDLLRTHAIGDFRQLLQGMARDVAMLLWLDGNANRKRHPNENFAREVMELFSLGVGNYSERDIQEAARAFSGWQVREGRFWFNALQHDTGTKTVFGRSGNFDGAAIVDLCLQQPACARFLAYKLLRTFVVDTPDPDLIEALAQRIRKHEFSLAPVLRELFASRLFFSAPVRGALIKSPLELVLGACRTLGCAPRLNAVIPLLAALGQDVFEPPTVKGWEGGRLWISSTSMLQRVNFATELVTGTRLGTIANPELRLGAPAVETPSSIIHDYTQFLLNREPDPELAASLIESWTQTPGDRSARTRGVLQLLMTVPEFQLM